jgi:hypothetical protein
MVEAITAEMAGDALAYQAADRRYARTVRPTARGQPDATEPSCWRQNTHPPRARSCKGFVAAMVVIRGFHWAIHSRPKKAPPILLGVANRHRANLALISLPHRHPPSRCGARREREAWSTARVLHVEITLRHGRTRSGHPRLSLTLKKRCSLWPRRPGPSRKPRMYGSRPNRRPDIVG